MTDDATSVSPDEPEVATESDSERRHRDDTRKNRVELAGAIIIGIAAVLTALATFQGAKVDGEVGSKHTEAITHTLFANDSFNQASAARAIERDWIFSYMTEAENGNPAQDFLVEAMPDEVLLVADEWLNTDDDILDPFSDAAADQYESVQNLPSTQLALQGELDDAAAECAIFESLVAERRGDDYGLSTVFLAISLVVGGIAALLRGKAAQTIVLTTAALSLVLGAGLLAVAGDAEVAREDQAREYFSEDADNLIPGAEALRLADELCEPPEG